MTKFMKIKSLKDYGIPYYILDIWEKHYSPYLLPIQEEAVRDYGVLDGGGRVNDRAGRMNPTPTFAMTEITLTLPSPLKGEGILRNPPLKGEN